MSYPSQAFATGQRDQLQAQTLPRPESCWWLNRRLLQQVHATPLPRSCQRSKRAASSDLSQCHALARTSSDVERWHLQHLHSPAKLLSEVKTAACLATSSCFAPARHLMRPKMWPLQPWAHTKLQPISCLKSKRWPFLPLANTRN